MQSSQPYTAQKVSKCRVFSGLSFPVFSPNMGKKDQKLSKFGHFLRSAQHGIAGKTRKYLGKNALI